MGWPTRKGSGKGKGKGSGKSDGQIWYCNACGFANFPWHRFCDTCQEPREKRSSSTGNDAQLAKQLTALTKEVTNLKKQSSNTPTPADKKKVA